MKTVTVTIFLWALSGGALADPPKEVMNIVRWDDVKFVPSPIVPGAANAVISGDPRVPEKPYVVRNRFAPGTFSMPHFHPETRYIQVLKGTWWVGSGPKFDKNATTPVPDRLHPHSLSDEPRFSPMNPSFHSLYTMISVAPPGPPLVTAWMTPNALKNAKTMLTTTR